MAEGLQNERSAWSITQAAITHCCHPQYGRLSKRFKRGTARLLRRYIFRAATSDTFAVSSDYAHHPNEQVVSLDKKTSILERQLAASDRQRHDCALYERRRRTQPLRSQSLFTNCVEADRVPGVFTEGLAPRSQLVTGVTVASGRRGRQQSKRWPQRSWVLSDVQPLQTTERFELFAQGGSSLGEDERVHPQLGADTRAKWPLFLEPREKLSRLLGVSAGAATVIAIVEPEVDQGQVRVGMVGQRRLLAPLFSRASTH
ncbi:SAM-dependent methyltransferase [Bradyrhizobium brasilense]|uniref:SAM-dependent methyltransferase n=1 Tax=Bradyrhizobium brasilense TaxID=1419277 RepID=UPI0035C7833A